MDRERTPTFDLERLSAAELTALQEFVEAEMPDDYRMSFLDSLVALPTTSERGAALVDQLARSNQERERALAARLLGRLALVDLDAGCTLWARLLDDPSTSVVRAAVHALRDALISEELDLAVLADLIARHYPPHGRATWYGPPPLDPA